VSSIPTNIICESLTASDQSSPWSDLEIAHPISGDTGSQEAVSRVRTWLNRCSGEHSMCANTTARALPTRVIRIDGPKDVKLYIPDQQEARYVCLSHCWGNGSVIRTTKQNLSSFRLRIPWQELSRTFRDAIDFAYRLGFIYIWIDSFCIVQDSAEDWRHEGGRMDSIYANASLTLAATKSADSTKVALAARARYTSLANSL